MTRRRQMFVDAFVEGFRAWFWPAVAVGAAVAIVRWAW